MIVLSHAITIYRRNYKMKKNELFKELVESFDEFSSWLEEEKKNYPSNSNIKPTFEEYISWLDEHKLKKLS